MGGEGSGRKPSTETLIARSQPEQNPVGTGIFIPNYSGIQDDAKKTSTGHVVTDLSPLSLDKVNSRVGLGITTPLYDFDITKTVDDIVTLNTWNKSDGNAAQAITRTRSDQTNYIDLVSTSSTYNQFPTTIFTSGQSIIASSSLRSFVIGTELTCPMIFFTGGVLPVNERMRILSTGQVGIGTTTPTVPLHVSGNETINGILLLSGASVSPLQIITSEVAQTADVSANNIVIKEAGNGGITIFSSTTTNGAIYFGDSDANFRGAIDYDHNGDIFTFWAGAALNSTMVGAAWTCAGAIGAANSAAPTLTLTRTSGAMFVSGGALWYKGSGATQTLLGAA